VHLAEGRVSRTTFQEGAVFALLILATPNYTHTFLIVRPMLAMLPYPNALPFFGTVSLPIPVLFDAERPIRHYLTQLWRNICTRFEASATNAAIFETATYSVAQSHQILPGERKCFRCQPRPGHRRVVCLNLCSTNADARSVCGI